MNFKQFQKEAMRTESTIEAVKQDHMTMLHLMTLADAAVAAVDAYKKHIYYGKPIDKTKLAGLMLTAEGSAKLLSDRVCSDKVASTDGYTTFKIDPRILHAVLGKFTESGEMLQALVPAMFDGKELDMVNLREEMGDDQWYDAILYDATGSDHEKVCDTVIAKLKKRYPEKFDAKKAINRDTVVERQVLEEGLGS